MKFRKKLMITLAILTFTGILKSQNNDGFPITEVAQTMLDELVDFNVTVGISAGIYSEEHDLEWIGAAGYSDMYNKKKASGDMLHRTASISKPMTAVAILQLFESGKLDLDDPIQQYIPDFPVSPKGEVTIRHLLQHSSGVTAYRSASEAANTKNYPSLLNAIDVFKNRELAHVPGKGYQYTTYGYVILGAVIEKASGMSYRSYMKKYVWGPAEMRDTDVEIFGKNYKNKSKLYKPASGSTFENDVNTDLSIKIPGGGIQSTAGDLIRFGQAILNHKLLKPETSRLMMTDTGVKKRGNPYGLGWFLYAPKDGRFGRIIGHSGSQSGTSTQLMVFVDKKAVICVQSNTSGVWRRIFSLADELDNTLFESDKIVLPYRKAVSLPNTELDSYVGTYATSNEGKVKIRRKGSYISAKWDSSEWNRMFIDAQKNLFSRKNDIYLKFNQKDSAKNGFSIMKNGNEVTFSRINAKKSLVIDMYNVYLEKGVEYAEKCLRENLNNDSYDFDPGEMNELAYEFMQSGEFNEALYILNLNVELAGKDIVLDEETILSIARQLLPFESYDIILRLLDLNTKQFPESWQSYNILGDVYLKMQKSEKAKKMYVKALGINDGNEHAKTKLDDF